MNQYSIHRVLRARARWQLLAALASGAAVLFGCLGLFDATHYTRVVPSFHRQIVLPRGATLDIAVAADCPQVIPEMACRDSEQEFSRVFKVVYWSAGESHTLASIAMPRR